jgi:type IV secretion system protein VirB9
VRHALFLALLLPIAAEAQIRPQPGPGDPRIQSVEYSPDQVVTIEATPGYQVTIELAPDERVENVAVGDSGAWQVTANRRGNRLFVKPVQPGVTTNMMVVTDARRYNFELAPSFGGSMAWSVRFNYPDPRPAMVDPAAPEQTTEGRYRLRGAQALRPSGIHDDGVHTYIDWPEDRSLPAIYAIDDRGKETLVNGMMRDGRMVIDSVQQKLVFRIDNRSATALRIEEKR